LNVNAHVVNDSIDSRYNNDKNVNTDRVLWVKQLQHPVSLQNWPYQSDKQPVFASSSAEARERKTYA